MFSVRPKSVEDDSVKLSLVAGSCGLPVNVDTRHTINNAVDRGSGKLNEDGRRRQTNAAGRRDGRAPRRRPAPGAGRRSTPASDLLRGSCEHARELPQVLGICACLAQIARLAEMKKQR
ncbi:hypothetical protein EVAR_50642_1 [Eumeta japonica]|uniref:Uncharacterized protein n=1 Tax=Eumeta variegata TaxID=151549 RepID=A0A4C1XI16_EUMVA|nr:hypothetical protein EVAR_50642_1 [Eumeta japonica]